MTELKPCPFCGSERVHVRESSVNIVWVRCRHCAADGPPVDKMGEHEKETAQAINLWNTRTKNPPKRVSCAIGRDGLDTSGEEEIS